MRRELAYLMDILSAADELARFVADTNEVHFLGNKPQQSFVFHRLVVIGEAANSIPRELQARHPQVPWARLVALRNRLVHAYFDLDLPLLWNLASTQVTELHDQVAAVIRAEFPGAIEDAP